MDRLENTQGYIERIPHVYLPGEGPINGISWDTDDPSLLFHNAEGKVDSDAPKNSYYGLIKAAPVARRQDG